MPYTLSLILDIDIPGEPYIMPENHGYLEWVWVSVDVYNS